MTASGRRGHGRPHPTPTAVRSAEIPLCKTPSKSLSGNSDRPSAGALEAGNLTTPEKTTEGVRMNTTRSRGSRLNEAAPMIVRLAQGSLMAGHGAQKLFGSFGGAWVGGHQRLHGD